jgi:hypothetical protein
VKLRTTKLLAELKILREKVRLSRTRAQDLTRYRTDPAGYARDVLRVSWWSRQAEIAEALTRPPYRVLVKASHSVGKSHLAGGLVNWWYDTRSPGVCLTTAPTARQVRDVLWKEIRRQRGKRPGFPGPKIPRLEDSADHFAHGFTARDATAFQGQHEAAVLLVFDEAVGVGAEFWDAAESMCQGQEYGWLAIFNPTDTTSRAYLEEQAGNGRWTVIEIPATDHPNIAAELAGESPPYPQAVRLDWLKGRIDQWCERLPAEDAQATDLEFPPRSGEWWRPGPLAEARLLARWPSAGSGVWSDAAWGVAEAALLDPGPADLPEIGCDVARFGDDWTEIHVRCGPVSLHHESRNGWSTDQTAGRLKELAREWAQWCTDRRDTGLAAVDPQQLDIKIDDDGVGGGVVDQAGGFNFVGVSAASRALDTESYPNRRSELWFAVAERAKRGTLALGRLPQSVRVELKRQAMAPRWKLDGSGRRVVEPKDQTRKTLGRSPDGMDAVNLAYAPANQIGVAHWVG